VRNIILLSLEGGDSSSKIYNLFHNVKKINYYVFESNPNYLPTSQIFNGILYNENELSNIQLEDYIQENILFDLVLIDGPNGNARKYWYNKIKPFIKIGTIILIDDFNHYECFGIELDLNYEYELLSLSMIPFVPYGEHSWKIVRVSNIT
jgi:hypothetical protein